MFKQFFSIFQSPRVEKLNTFFVGQAVSIAQAYYKDTKDSPVKTPVYGWTVKSVSDTYITLVSGDGQKKAFVEGKYLERG
jgi:hypothetical protein